MILHYNCGVSTTRVVIPSYIVNIRTVCYSLLSHSFTKTVKICETKKKNDCAFQIKLQVTANDKEMDVVCFKILSQYLLEGNSEEFESEQLVSRSKFKPGAVLSTHPRERIRNDRGLFKRAISSAGRSGSKYSSVVKNYERSWPI
jgi:hypothetical protein